MNTFGNIFRLTSFGESHGAALGGVVDGMPAGIDVDLDFIQRELARRRPGQSRLTTSRREADEVELLSGVFEGKSTGCPIGFIIRNTNQHSSDYDDLRRIFRPSHADYTYYNKYGLRDHRGGGRSSARETVSRCVAGALAKLALRQLGITVEAYTSQVGSIVLPGTYADYDLSLRETNAVRCPDTATAERMAALIEEVKADGDTIGGCVQAVIRGCPVGLGEPVFGKLHAALGAAMLSINAAKGFDYGMGFDGVAHRGSEMNQHPDGIEGGISAGRDITFRVAFKPVATILREQTCLTLDGTREPFTPHGRHDPCVLPRAVPIVESMAAMVILDYYLLNKTIHL